MRKIMSISLGASSRDHVAVTEILNERFHIERIGTNGDMKKAIQLLQQYDGKVDAFGMGGIDFYIYVGKGCHEIRDAKVLKNTPKISPIVDGSGLKNTLERKVIAYLDQNRIISFQNKKVLLVSAADRFGMAESLDQAGSDLICGDLMFTLGIPYPIKSLKSFFKIASCIAPLAVMLPFNLLYPTGVKQEIRQETKYEVYYNEADIIAGDYHYIKKYMPLKMKDKIIITNTTTQQDIYDMKQRGVSLLITTTPELNGRSFGTNVMEAVLISLMDKEFKDINELDYHIMLDKLQLKPRITHLNEKEFQGFSQ